MSDLFKDILPSIQLTKKHVLEDEKDYNPYMVNKFISLHDDGLFYAAEMNRYPQLSKMAQYTFYLHALKSRRRPFVKMAKPVKQEDVELVKQYFGYNEIKARDVLGILNTNQLEMIRKSLTIGEMK